MRDGFAILKVGPWLTFALREALYALDAISAELYGRSGPTSGPKSGLKSGMEALMLAAPDHWSGHYHGTPEAIRLNLHFSYSDRIRYYWSDPAATRLVDELMAGFGARAIPETLISQYFGALWPLVLAGEVAPTAEGLMRASVDAVLAVYDGACGAP